MFWNVSESVNVAQRNDEKKNTKYDCDKKENKNMSWRTKRKRIGEGEILLGYVLR